MTSAEYHVNMRYSSLFNIDCCVQYFQYQIHLQYAISLQLYNFPRIYYRTLKWSKNLRSILFCYFQLLLSDAQLLTLFIIETAYLNNTDYSWLQFSPCPVVLKDGKDFETQRSWCTTIQVKKLNWMVLNWSSIYLTPWG